MRRVATLSIMIAICISSVYSQDNCRCCSAEYRQFDFWIGSWETIDSAGKVLGTNTIDIIQDSCILRENWISATPGYTGTSYNYFNSQTEIWTQVWVDNQGGSLLLTGGLKENAMVLKSAPGKNAQGQKFVNRITWIPNPEGTVRQLWQTKVEDNAWTVAFDGLYRKVE